MPDPNNYGPRPWRTFKEIQEEINKPRPLTAEELELKKKRAEARRQARARLQVANRFNKDPETRQKSLLDPQDGA